MMALAAPAAAQRWTLVPTLAADETYTSNLRLAPRGAERSDWVTELRPAAALNATGGRLRVDVTYALQALHRAQEGSSEVFHLLSARTNTELARQLVYFDASASISQQDVSLAGPQAASNVNVTGNRTSVKSYVLSPYLQRPLGSQAIVNARFTHSSVGSSTSAAAAPGIESDSEKIDLGVSSGPAFRLTTWNIGYSAERIAYSRAPDTSTARLFLGARRLVTPTFGVLFNAGYDRNNFVTASGERPYGASWSIGPEWVPTPRTRLAATLGRRYNSVNRSLEFSHRTRLTVWSATYSEDITTTRQQVVTPTIVETASFMDALFAPRIADPVERRAAVQEYIQRGNLPATMQTPLNFFTTVPFISRRWQGSVALQGARHTLLATTFVQTREALNASQPGLGDFALSARTRQAGGDLAWSLRMTPLTTSTVGVGITRNELPGAGREDENRFLRAGLTRQLLPRASASAQYRLLRSDSSIAAAGYTEHALSASLTVRF